MKNQKNRPQFPPDTKVYSYVRFSTPEQRKGTGQKRQDDLANQWCQANGLRLEKNYADLGISAFKGKNAAVGALAKFKKCIKTGKIKRGSVLIVESLDRLSRDRINKAAELFLSIINRGITVVTLCDNYVYSEEKFDLGQLMMSLAILMRGNDESRMKSLRKGANWKYKREKAKRENSVLGGKTPSWIKVKDGKYTLVEDMAKKVRAIFADYVGGLGIYSLNKKYNIPKPTISYWLNNPVVRGTITVTEGGKEYQIHDHYPAVIDQATWDNAQSAKAQRYIQRRVTGRTGFVNLFSGILVDHKEDRFDVVRHYGFSSYVSRNGYVLQARPMETALLAYKLHDAFVTVSYVAIPEKENRAVIQIDQKIKEVKEALLNDSSLASDLLPILRQLKSQRRNEATGGATRIEQKVDHVLIRQLLDGEADTEERLRLRNILLDTVEQVRVKIVDRNNHYVFVSGEMQLTNGKVRQFRYAYGTRHEGIVLCDDCGAYDNKHGTNPYRTSEDYPEDAYHHGIDDNVGVWAKDLNDDVIEAIKKLPLRKPRETKQNPDKND